MYERQPNFVLVRYMQYKDTLPLSVGASASIRYIAPLVLAVVAPASKSDYGVGTPAQRFVGQKALWRLETAVCNNMRLQAKGGTD